MAKFGCPPRFIAMVRKFHDGMQTRVQTFGEYSEPFLVINRVKQGCVMAPTMFSMMFSVMSFQDCDAGFPIRYRFDTKLFNLERLQANAKVQRMPNQRQKCKGLWIAYQKFMAILTLQSV